MMTDSNQPASGQKSPSLPQLTPSNAPLSASEPSGAMDSTKERQIGRNEECPCGSGKKYKRCHGVGAAPKLTQPKAGLAGMGGLPGGALPPDAAEMMKNVDPAFMKNMMNIMGRVPKGQLQRLQIMMQKAAKGEDVSREAADLERVLPQEFTALMRQAAISQQFAAMSQGGAGGAEDASAVSVPNQASEMSIEEARKIVEAAAKEGKIEKEKATEVLAATDGLVQDKKGGLFKKLFGKSK